MLKYENIRHGANGRPVIGRVLPFVLQPSPNHPPVRRETRHLIAGLMPAAFALGMACLYWSAWLRPGRWDPEQLLDLARLVLFQALLIHAGAFLTLVQTMPTRNGAAGLLAGLAGGYGFFAFVFSFMIGSIWPLVVFGGTLVAELPQLLVRQSEWVPADKKAERVTTYGLLVAVPGLFLFFTLVGAMDHLVPGDPNQCFGRTHPEDVPNIERIRYLLITGFWHHLLQVGFCVACALAARHQLASLRRLGPEGKPYAAQCARAEQAIMATVMGGFALVGFGTAFARGADGNFHPGWLVAGCIFTMLAALLAVPVVRDRVVSHALAAERRQAKADAAKTAEDAARPQEAPEWFEQAKDRDT